MRNTQERVMAAKRKACVMQQRNRQRAMAISGVLSLCMVVGIACIVPSLLSNYTVTPGEGLFGSVFATSQSFAYIMVGILSFFLGICLTMFCLFLRKKNAQDNENLAEDDE